MDQFLIKPTFRGNEATDSRYIEFDGYKVNALAEAEYLDVVTPYQQAFGLYEWMTLNRLGEFVLHYPVSNMLLLQPHNSCAWTPQGYVRFAERSIQAGRAKINVEDCYDELFNSPFEKMLDWRAGRAELGVAARYTDMLVRTITQQSAIGTQATLTAGGLFPAIPTFAEGVPTNVRNAFMRSAYVHKGWMQNARELKATDPAKYGHLDNNLIQAGDLSTDGKRYTGDVLALFDARFEAATDKMQSGLIMGGKPNFNARAQRPVWLVSPSIVMALRKAKQEQDAALATNQVRITTQSISAPGGNGSTDALIVYLIDDVPVIPIYEVSMFTEFLQGTAHFDYLTLTGVIQLGGSFTEIPSIGRGIAIRVQQSDRNQDLGKTTYLAHMLLAAAFADTDYLCGGYTYFTPAA